MAFNTDNDYTPYENFVSLGTTSPEYASGIVQPEEGAKGFSYLKHMLRTLYPSGSGGLSDPVTFTWRVAVRESSDPTSKVLFRQTVTYKGTAVFDPTGGGVPFTTTNDDGDFETEIVNGEAVPQDSTGHYEGWRYIDLFDQNPGNEIGGILPGTDTTSNSGVSVLVNRMWYSRPYQMDLPPGAVFVVEEDDCREGRDIPIAFFEGSILRADAPTPALFDTRTGQQFRALAQSGQTRVLRSRRQLSPLKPTQAEWSPATSDGLVLAKNLRGLSLSRGGAGTLMLLGQDGETLHLFRSQDEAKTWQSLMTQPSEITLLAARLAKGGTRFIIYGVDKNKTPSYVILKNEDQGWAISESGPCQGQNLPTTKINSLEEAEGGTLRLLATTSDGNLQLFHSADGKSYQQAPLPPTTGDPQ